MFKRIFIVTVAALIAFVLHALFIKLDSWARASAQPAPVCYGQYKPICSLGQKATCVCSGDIGQDCRYVCM